MGQNFKTIQCPDQILNRVQDNISSAFNSVTGPFIGGNYLTGISIVSGTPMIINHGLARQPVIWSLGDINASATVYRSAWNSNSITLNASADCTISLWVN